MFYGEFFFTFHWPLFMPINKSTPDINDVNKYIGSKTIEVKMK